MSSLFEQIAGQLAGGPLSSLSQQVGADESSTQKAIMAALPMLMGALASNASRPEGAEALANALERDHDGSIVDDLARAASSPNLADGEGILGHILGNRKGAVQSGVGKMAGLDEGQAGKLLASLAPMVLGYLGRAKKTQGLNPSDLAGMLGQERNRIETQVPGGAGLLKGLDQDGDGSILDDVGGALLKNLFNR